MASKKELFKKKAQELTAIHNVAKPTALGAFNDVERVKSSIEILPELKTFIRPLTSEQFFQLEQNIITHGCQDALVLWETTNYDLGRGEEEKPVYILIDGHNRYEICQKNKVDFKITLKVFESIEAVKEYMIDLQIGRRNLTLEEESYYRGLKYNAQKGGRGSALLMAQKGEAAVNVADELSKKFSVTSRTIKNDGKFADGMNKLSQDLRNEILQGSSKISRKYIQSLADLNTDTAEINSIEELSNFLRIREDENKVEDNKQLLIWEIMKLTSQLKTQKNCDLLIKKVTELKGFLQK